MRLPSVLVSLFLSAAAAFSADSALLNLVMPEARMVAGIDVERARNSFLGKKMLEQMESKDSDFAKFVAMTGFDPRRDLREVIVAAPDANTKNSPLMLVRGVFDVSRINGFLKSSGAAVAENFSGVDFYTKPNSKEDMGFALIDSSLAVAGSKEVVRAALKRRSGTGSALTADTYAKVQNMSRSNDMWVVSTVPVSDLSNKFSDATGKPILPSTSSATALGIRVINDMDRAATALAKIKIARPFMLRLPRMK